MKAEKHLVIDTMKIGLLKSTDNNDNLELELVGSSIVVYISLVTRHHPVDEADHIFP